MSVIDEALNEGGRARPSCVAGGGRSSTCVGGDGGKGKSSFVIVGTVLLDLSTPTLEGNRTVSTRVFAIHLHIRGGYDEDAAVLNFPDWSLPTS